MINLEIERKKKLTSQEVYDIIAKAIDLANDNGFINSFVFERALYISTLATVNEEDRDKIADMFSEGKSPLIIWDWLINNEKDKYLLENFEYELSYIEKEASTWFSDYEKYAASPRGMIDSLEGLTSSFANNMSDQVAALQDNSKINETLEIAEKWGMNNSIEDSLFFEDTSASTAPTVSTVILNKN